MLEFNIDKQAGIQLHTCERKSRWCKFFLLSSWVLVLGGLGWLFWNGFLSLNTQPGVKAALVTSTITPAITPKPVTPTTPKVSSKIPECPKIDTSSSKEFQKNCDKKLAILNLQLKQLKQSNLKLKASAVTLKKSQEKLIREKAFTEKTLTDKSLTGGKDPDLLEKLFYYEKILHASGKKDAISLNHFSLKKLEKTGHYRFQLVLARLGKLENTSGKFELFLKGEKRVEVTKDVKTEAEKASFTKQAVTYKHTDLLPQGALADSNTFAFKYYQDLERVIVLPENFEPQSVSVSINPKGLSTLKNNFEWKDAEQRSFKKFN